ncbi:hypothetical protein EON64_16980 [archaeon]|nr:MAG: hypothetical protein EON64_16980 [archaeon]
MQTEIKHIRTFDPSISERRARIVQAKLAEYIMAHICTKPNIFTPYIGSYARWVISTMAKKYPLLKDPLKVADIADKVLLSLERRTWAVTRYTARAQNMHQAAKNVAMYMRKAIKRRFYDHLESEISVLPSKPVSTMRRWKNKDKIDVTNIAAADSLMRARKSGVQPGRVSVNQLSKWSKLSRGAVGRALARAEAKHGFSAERFRNNIAQLTPEQVRWVKKNSRLPEVVKTRVIKSRRLRLQPLIQA